MPVFDLVRAVQIAAIGLALGMLVIVVRLSREAATDVSPLGQPADRRLRVWIASVVLAGSASAGSGLVLAHADTARAGWGIAAGAWLVLVAALMRGGLHGRSFGSLRPAVAAGMALVIFPALVGNAAKDADAWLVVPANALHVAAAGTWAGGVASLLVLSGLRDGDHVDRRRTAALSGLLAWFSGLALVAVVALALSGVLQGLVLVGRIDALVTTGYGRLVAIKALLLCALAALGAVQRGRTLPELHAAAGGGEDGSARALLRRVLGAELALLMVVLATTGVLAASVPVDTAGSRAVVRTFSAGGIHGRARIAPAAPGNNRVVISLSGRDAGSVTGLVLRERQPKLGIGPLQQAARRTGQARFDVAGVPLSAPGTWELTLSMRTPRGLASARFTVPLR